MVVSDMNTERSLIRLGTALLRDAAHSDPGIVLHTLKIACDQVGVPCEIKELDFIDTDLALQLITAMIRERHDEKALKGRMSALVLLLHPVHDGECEERSKA